MYYDPLFCNRICTLRLHALWKISYKSQTLLARKSFAVNLLQNLQQHGLARKFYKLKIMESFSIESLPFDRAYNAYRIFFFDSASWWTVGSKIPRSIAGAGLSELASIFPFGHTWSEIMTWWFEGRFVGHDCRGYEFFYSESLAAGSLDQLPAPLERIPADA